ncbi:MAG: hypothetical protein HYU39_01970 [Thaumarchaeota archaeon]|nr:hypothetical protein [Nitrososphaerota archaeon]
MSNFARKWVKPEAPSITARMKDAVRPAGPLKPRLELAGRQIQAQVAKLDSTFVRLKEKDNALFNKIVAAIRKHDTQMSIALSNELVEVRKIAKMISQAKLALEQIVLRLGTVQELGDITVTLAPAVGIIRSVRGGLQGVIPEAEGEIGEISSTLSSILVDAGQLGNLSLNFESANEESDRILTEASAVAEQGLKDSFPEIAMPAEIPRSAEAVGGM